MKWDRKPLQRFMVISIYVGLANETGYSAIYEFYPLVILKQS